METLLAIILIVLAFFGGFLFGCFVMAGLKQSEIDYWGNQYNAMRRALLALQRKIQS